VVIGSERGLCGRFNISVADHAERYLRRESARGLNIDLTVLGSRAERALRRRGLDPALVGGISPTRVPTLALALELSRRWLTAYEKRQLDAVDVIRNAYRGTGAYQPTTTRLIPPELPRRETVPSPEAGRNQPSKDTRSAEARAESWPPPIVETDPLSLYTTVVEQWAAARLLELLSDSSAAEHSTRFQLMESATQNADRLIEELTLIVQTERRKEITQEMAELATGAGLVGRD
jgi:F-type H+-transporting ATPase subunit gamma